MTFSQFATDTEKLDREWTRHSGIAVTIDPNQPFFSAIVNQTLDSLNTLPTGKQLLKAIDDAAPADNRGFKVLITRVPISYKQAMDRQGSVVINKTGNSVFKPSGGRSYAGPAQKELGVNSDAAYDGASGVSVIVGWCQNQCTYTPKTGQNPKTHFVPPTVTLGHELIHAYHSLKGVLKSGHTIVIDGKQTSEEEAATVGLGKYSDATYTENKLRAEVGLPRRLSYP